MFTCLQAFKSSVAPRLCIGASSRNLSGLTPPLQSRKQSLAEELGLPNAPPLPAKPFHKYMAEQRNVMQNLPWSERRNKLSESWKSLDKDEKQSRVKAYEEEQVEYKNSFLAFISALSPQQLMSLRTAMSRRSVAYDKRASRRDRKKDAEANGRPKRPVNPFVLFLDEVVQKDSGSRKDVVRNAAEQWKALEPEQRQGFMSEYEAQMRQYSTRLQLWEDRMCEEGRVDLVRVPTKRKFIKDKRSMAADKEVSTGRADKEVTTGGGVDML